MFLSISELTTLFTAHDRILDVKFTQHVLMSERGCVWWTESWTVIHSACGRQRSILQLLSGCCVKQRWRRRIFQCIY